MITQKFKRGTKLFLTLKRQKFFSIVVLLINKTTIEKIDLQLVI